jgi:hypothetical protein
VKVAAASAGALFVAGGAVVITAGATGLHLGPVPASATQPPTAVASPAPAAPAAPAMADQKAARQALLNAEAQVLGLKSQQLAVDLRQGTTLHQLADQKGLSQAQFDAALTAQLKPMLDQAVTGQQVTPAQEQRLLKQLAKGVPNWDGAAKPKAGQPAPTPSPAAATQ